MRMIYVSLNMTMFSASMRFSTASIMAGFSCGSSSSSSPHSTNDPFVLFRILFNAPFTSDSLHKY